MFTGIIENTGYLVEIKRIENNLQFVIESPFSTELSVDQSVNHDGVCLTVELISGRNHTVTAIAETLTKTNLANWKEGRTINLERAMVMNGRFDGHIVQGHVDCTATCVDRKDCNGSIEFTFQLNSSAIGLIIEKGSITINGISLTIFNIEENKFTVGIIPYTYSHTNFKELKIGDTVNIEFDVIGKYVQRLLTK